MDEKQWKFILKQMIDNGYKNLNSFQKESLKQAIDEAKSFPEIYAIVFRAIQMERQ